MTRFKLRLDTNPPDPATKRANIRRSYDIVNDPAFLAHVENRPAASDLPTIDTAATRAMPLPPIRAAQTMPTRDTRDPETAANLGITNRQRHVRTAYYNDPHVRAGTEHFLSRCDHLTQIVPST